MAWVDLTRPGRKSELSAARNNTDPLLCAKSFLAWVNWPMGQERRFSGRVEYEGEFVAEADFSGPLGVASVGAVQMAQPGLVWTVVSAAGD